MPGKTISQYLTYLVCIWFTRPNLKGPQFHIEENLVALLKQRDQAAFGYLYDNYANSLNGVILNIVPDGHTAGDVLQEVFVKIWKYIEQYDAAKARLFTWMFNIARTTAIDTVRSRHWQNSIRNQSLGEGHEVFPDKQPDRLEERGLRAMVRSLKEEQRVLVELSYFQGYTQQEISEMLGIPLGTVKTRLRSALVQLRQYYKM